MHSGFLILAHMTSTIDLIVDPPAKLSDLDPLQFHEVNCMKF